MTRLTRNTGNTAGVFDDVTALAAVSTPNGRILSLSTGERYYTSSVDDGEGLLLIDGNYANPIYNSAPPTPEPPQQKILPFSSGTTSYTLQEQDTGYFIVFDDSSLCQITLLSSLSIGTSIVASNVGGGGVEIVTTDAVKGVKTLGNVDGMMSITKVTSIYWQSSERA